jgi:hypothetical protein
MERELCAMIDESCANAGGINALTVQLKTRQAVELLKVPALAQMARELIEEGNSVVIFTNFVATLVALCEALKTESAIYGTSSTGHAQTSGERQQIIDDFQADLQRIVIVNIAAGGVGVSLHDLNGRYPRVSLICPTYNAKQLKQAFGRAWRDGGLSLVIQRIIFAAGTIEETICRRVQTKLRNLELLNDGDLDISAGINIAQKNSEKSICANSEAADVAAPDLILDRRADSSNGSETPEMTLNNEITVSPQLKHNTRKHSRYSPSVLKPLAICSGFINDEFGDKKYADRGSRGHQCVEENTPNQILDDPSLKQAVIWCLAYKKHIIDKAAKHGNVQVYQEVELHYFDQWGFSDFIAISHNATHAALMDWKFANHFYAADAPQFWAYCLGIWNRWATVETLDVHVVHPFRGQIDVESFSRSAHYDLFAARVTALIERGRRNDPAEYQPAAQCAYCGHAGTCPALARIGIAIGARYDETFVVIPPSGSAHGSEITDPATMALLLRLAPIMDKAVRGWRKAGVDMWNQGTEIPGFELTHTAGRRVLDSARAAYAVVKDRIPVEQYLDACSVSVPELEKLYASTAKRGEKEKSKMQLMALLEDENLLSSGAGSAHLRPLRA